MSDSTPHIDEQQYLLHQQYRDASNLNARIELHQRFGTSVVPWYRWTFDQFKMPAGARVLELGCGTGRMWVENLDRLPHDWQVTLSDFSPGMLEEAQNNLAGSGHDFIFAVVDAQNIPFTDGYFDCVIANYMLFHVPDRARTIAEIRRVLSPEGRFYAATSGGQHMREMWDLVARVRDAGYQRPLPYGNFTLESGGEEIARQFAHVEVHHVDAGLKVTEAEPLLAYILSSRAAQSLDEEQQRRLRALIEQELARDGAIHITRTSGLFEAWGQRT